MSDIFQEVDEEVRRDKAAEFWKKYQNQILAAAVLVVLPRPVFAIGNMSANGPRKRPAISSTGADRARGRQDRRGQGRSRQDRGPGAERL